MYSCQVSKFRVFDVYFLVSPKFRLLFSVVIDFTFCFVLFNQLQETSRFRLKKNQVLVLQVCIWVLLTPHSQLHSQTVTILLS